MSHIISFILQAQLAALVVQYDKTTHNFFISCTKSAQIPFRAWLPIAIAAPTPVSALVHSSTLVTAGVWLLIRHTSDLHSLGISYILFYIGTLTILGSSISAIFEKDLKKIVALSTLSQLGIIIITLGIELATMAYLHIILHAYFKAIIFISFSFFSQNLNGP